MAVRTKNRGIIYLRRSSSKQELSLAGQLAWAIERAYREGVSVDATPADLDHMQRSGLHRYKSVYLDDSISGSDMLRPGFVELQSAARTDKSVSHIFAHMRDRLARPDDGMEMALIERDIRQRGVTFIFSNGVGEALVSDGMDLGEGLKLHVEYQFCGDFLVKLAERIVSGNRKIASMGRWVGGKAPYGFSRVFVNADGKFIQDLAPGQTMRQPGCHVQLRPSDTTKIGWWLYMLELAGKGWGFKRIANHLNELQVPSPDAGTVRKVGGVPRVHDGKWNHTTVADLIRNPALTGLIRFARRSMGQFRRAGVDGPRPLGDGDKTAEGRPKVIRNPKELQIIAPGGYDGYISTEDWEALQRQIDERGKNQRGIMRVSDPAKYPLSCRIIDMTNCCGATMYGRTSGKRAIYVCGRYEKNGATACDNNTVDAEAMLKLVIQFFQRSLGSNLESRLRQIWKTMYAQQPTEVACDARSSEFTALSQEKGRLESDKEQLRQNMRRGLSDELLQDLQQDYQKINRRLDLINQRLASVERVASRKEADPEQEIAAALQLLRNFEVVLTDPSARRELPGYFQRLGLRIGLNFREGKKGTKRRIRVLHGGVLTLADGQLPIALHGRDRVHDDSNAGGGAAALQTDQITNEDGTAAVAHTCVEDESGAVREPRSIEMPGANALGTNQSREDMRAIEGISSTKVSRGDRI